MHHKITIIRMRRPIDRNINEKLQWFGNSIGLFSLRDKDKSCFRIFITLLRASRADNGLTSDEIAHDLNLSRGTVIHHINKLRDSGIVVLEEGRYYLRVKRLSMLVDELEKDLARTMNSLREVAEQIDSNL